MSLTLRVKKDLNLQTMRQDMIAIAADGSFRDALGVTQKVIGAVEGKKGRRG